MRTEVEKELAHELRREAREKFNELDENFRLLYSTRQCQLCGAHLTIRQLNRVILQGAPPVCLKDYKIMQGEIDKLAPLFDQLKLF